MVTGFMHACLAVALLMSVLMGVAGAKSFEERTHEIGIAGGVLLPGNVYVSLHGDDVDRNANLVIRGFIDSYVVPKLAVGAYLGFSTLNLKEDIDVIDDLEIEKSGIKVLEVGGAIKPRFIVSPRVAIKPGLNIGYRRYFGETDFSTWQALGINGSCEFQYLLSGGKILFQETGFLSQPVGGNVDTDVTFDPTFYLLFGVVL